MLKHLCRIALIGSFTAITTAGQVSTDGTMGATQTLTGPNYTISQDLGATVGNNLFHSFGTFNLSQGDVATFTGANTIQNVISRVTDGNPSSIDGTIESQVGNANFFFINPSGMVFGQHAVVDVPAAFHASTANELRFADGTAYNLVTPKGSLTAAPPEAFGFLGNTGNIVIEGSQLKFKEGTEVSFTGDSITINNASINISSSTNGIQNTSGKICITANSLNVNASIIATDSISTAPAGDIIIMVQGNMQVTNGAIIGSDTNNQGNAGNVIVNTYNLILDGAAAGYAIITSQTGSDAPTTSGNAGSTTVTVENELRLVQGGAIFSTTFAHGNAGSVTIDAKHLIIDGLGTILFTGIASGANPGSHGNAGNVIINVDDEIQIMNGGEISTTTFAEGHAGTIVINAGYLTLDSQGSNFYTAISSSAQPNSTGNAGSITINLNDILQIINGGIIFTSTFNQSNAGHIYIHAHRLVINSYSAQTETGIASNSKPGALGNAGSINITIDEIINLNNGIISTYAHLGSGGSIIVNVPVIVINNSQIITSVLGSGGNGGDITLNGGYLVLDTGFIQANTAGEDAKGGNIFINMDGLLSNGGVTHIGGWEHETFNTNSGRNVIQAAANARENYGSIMFKNPNNDTAANIGANSNRLEPIKLATHPCEGTKGRFNFRRRGDVGLPNSGKDVIQPR